MGRVRKSQGFDQFFLVYPFPSASRRNTHFPEKFDWHFKSNIGTEGSQVCQKSVLQGYCVAEKVAAHTADFSEEYFCHSHVAFSEAN